MQPTIHFQRLTRLRSKLEDIGADAILINSAHNRRWLSGFSGSSGWLLVTGNRAILATDFRYWDQAVSQSPDFSLFKLSTSNTQTDLVEHANVRDIALESQHVTLKEYKTLQALEGIHWIPIEGLVESLRVIKDEEELDKIRAAAAITDSAMSSVRDLVRAGMSELELAWELEKSMREAGATGLTFPVHVASGPNAALPHHAPGERKISVGDIILVDMGASVDGYGSDLSRTYLFADEPDAAFAERYELVLNAHDEALQNIKPGRSGREIDAVARDMITAAGYGENFGHGLGHGLGLEGHEDPRLSTTRSNTPLEPGMVTTVEPGVYVSGWGGIRIEDLIVVAKDGFELLSHCPHEPLLGNK